MRRRMFVLTMAGCLLVAACGSSDPGTTASRSNANSDDTSVQTTDGTTPETTPDSSPVSTDVTDTSTADTTTGTDVTVPLDTMAPPSSVADNPNDATIDFGTNKTPQSYDTFLEASLADIQDFWRATYKEVYGSDFPELQGGIWASYPGREPDNIPTGCGGVGEGEDYIAQENAFYCSVGDYIAYDDYSLIPHLVEEFGESAVGVVFAHEFGHAIQYRVGALTDDVPTVYWEQQADCFAGAWTAHVARGESDRLQFNDDGVKAGLSAMVAVKDPIDPGAGEIPDHGNAFDRVGAFENGFKGGATACQKMETDPLPLLDLPFSTEEEAASGGNIPYDDIQSSVEQDLTRFWGGAVNNFQAPTITPYPHKGPFPSCEGIDDSQYPFNSVYCAADNTIHFDEGYAKTLYKTYGDFAVGYIISNAWSEAVQTQLGSNLSGVQRILVDDCLTGAWTKDTIPPSDGSALDDNQLYISPGDLDEAVETALLTTNGLSDAQMAGAFDKIDYFRAGVIGGIAECNNRITGG